VAAAEEVAAVVAVAAWVLLHSFRTSWLVLFGTARKASSILPRPQMLRSNLLDQSLIVARRT
jgi:hypothetical protein